MEESTTNCPQCGKITISNNTKDFRPFCSQLCKEIDLGNWATESYRIPEKDESETNEI